METLRDKSALVQRDIDILAPMAAKGLVKVALSVTTLDPKTARGMEPRAASPAKRLETIRKLSEAGIPVTVLVAPIIPAISAPKNPAPKLLPTHAPMAHGASAARSEME